MSGLYNIGEWEIKLNHNPIENKIGWEITNKETTNIYRTDTYENFIGIKPFENFHTIVTNALQSKPDFIANKEDFETKSCLFAL